VNALLVVAGSLALLAAAVHGVGGEVLVVRKLALKVLPPSVFGGPRTTKLMIRATWHMTTIAFLTVGVALVLAGSVLEGDTARGIGVVAAAASTGFAAVALGGGLALALEGSLARAPRAMFRHPAPVGLTVIAVLAWLGVT
jgi:hypothetical protein